MFGIFFCKTSLFAQQKFHVMLTAQHGVVRKNIGFPYQKWVTFPAFLLTPEICLEIVGFGAQNDCLPPPVFSGCGRASF